MKKAGVLIISLLILMGCGQTEKEAEIFMTIIPPEEVSDMVVYHDYLYAGGLEGLYVIDVEQHVLKEHYEGYSTVKDLFVHDDVLYIGHDQGLSAFDGQQFTQITRKEDHLEDYRVNAVMIDSEARIWIGTYKGLYVLDDNHWTNINSKGQLLHDTVFSIYEDSFGGVWIGHYASPKGGISYVKDDNWQYFTKEDGLPHNNVNGFYEYDDLMYVSTGFYSEGGIGIFDRLDGVPYLSDSVVKDWGENGSKVRHVSMLNDSIFIGTEYDGLYVITPDSEALYTTDSGLSSVEIKSILFINDEIWLGTRLGISYGEVSGLGGVQHNNK